MSKQSTNSPSCGFSILELVVILAGLAILAGAVLPALAQTKPRTQQAVCFNNLRLVGQAMALFNAENGQRDPWRTVGGLPPSGLGQNSWFQFSFLSNGVSNPKVFVCPSDASRRAATDFSIQPGGFLSASYRNNAVSYFLGLDSSANLPSSVLAGDRNIQIDSVSSGCSSGINPAAAIFSPRASLSWLQGLHGPSGNILLHDGRVDFTSSQTLVRYFNFAEDNGSTHLLVP